MSNKNSNKTINDDRFVNYQKQIIDLLAKVCYVSVETIEIIQDMENQA